jgi:uncharacterized protein YjbI with pentapeptide repeats
MNSASVSRSFGFTMLLLFSAGHPTHAEQQFARSWTDQSGKTRSWSDLREMLLKHQQSIESGGQAQLLDLRGAKLVDANLFNWKLDYANLSDADLSHANLSFALVRDVDLIRANLSYADLSDAILSSAYATILKDANLTHAILTGANLTDV